MTHLVYVCLAMLVVTISCGPKPSQNSTSAGPAQQPSAPKSEEPQPQAAVARDSMTVREFQAHSAFKAAVANQIELDFFQHNLEKGLLSRNFFNLDRPTQEITLKAVEGLVKNTDPRTFLIRRVRFDQDYSLQRYDGEPLRPPKAENSEEVSDATAETWKGQDLRGWTLTVPVPGHEPEFLDALQMLQQIVEIRARYDKQDKTIQFEQRPWSLQRLEKVRESVLAADALMSQVPQVRVVSLMDSMPFNYVPSLNGHGEKIDMSLYATRMKDVPAFVAKIQERMDKYARVGIPFYFHGDAGMSSDLDTGLDTILSLGEKFRQFVKSNRVQYITVGNQAKIGGEVVIDQRDDTVVMNLAANASAGAVAEGMRQIGEMQKIQAYLGVVPMFDPSIYYGVKEDLGRGIQGEPAAIQSIFDRAEIIDVLLKLAPSLRESGIAFHYIGISRDPKIFVDLGENLRRLIVHPKSAADQILAAIRAKQEQLIQDKAEEEAAAAKYQAETASETR